MSQHLDINNSGKKDNLSHHQPSSEKNDQADFDYDIQSVIDENKLNENLSYLDHKSIEADNNPPNNERRNSSISQEDLPSNSQNNNESEIKLEDIQSNEHESNRSNEENSDNDDYDDEDSNGSYSGSEMSDDVISDKNHQQNVKDNSNNKNELVIPTNLLERKVAAPLDPNHFKNKDELSDLRKNLFDFRGKSSEGIVLNSEESPFTVRSEDNFKGRKYLEKGGTCLIAVGSEKDLKLNGHEEYMKKSIDSNNDKKFTWSEGRYQIKCIFFFVNYLLCFGILIGLMAFHFGDKDFNLSDTSGGLAYISSNLEANPIIHITIADDCPKGSSPLVLGTWPGTVPGCACEQFEDIKKGFCAPDQKAYCDDVDSNKPADLYHWKTDQNWCGVIAVPEEDFVITSQCPDNFRECSPGLCFKNEINCPITKIEFTGYPDSENNYPYSEGRYLNLYSSNGDSPLIGFNISLSDLPCANPKLSPNEEDPYVLLNLPSGGCGKLDTDKNSVKLDLDTENNVLQTNNFPDTIIDLPKYNEISQDTTAFFSSKYRFKLKNEGICLEIDTSELHTVSDKTSKMNTTISVCTIFGLIFRIFISFWVIFLLYNSYKKKLTILTEFKNWKLLRKAYLIAFGIEGLIYLIMGSLVGNYSGSLGATQEYFQQLSQEGCFLSEQPKEVIENYNSLVEKVVNKLNQNTSSLVAIAIICYVGLVGPDIFDKLRRYYDSRKNKSVRTIS